MVEIVGIDRVKTAEQLDGTEQLEGQDAIGGTGSSFRMAVSALAEKVGSLLGSVFLRIDGTSKMTGPLDLGDYATGGGRVNADDDVHVHASGLVFYSAEEASNPLESRFQPGELAYFSNAEGDLYCQRKLLNGTSLLTLISPITMMVFGGGVTAYPITATPTAYTGWDTSGYSNRISYDVPTALTTILVSGWYQVSAVVAFEGSKAQTITFQFEHNGVLTGNPITITLTDAGASATFAVPVTVELAVNDTLQLMISGSGTDVEVINSTLRIDLLSTEDQVP